MKEFTPQQISDFKKYEKVRMSGLFNMYDPQAREATGLSGKRYGFVMDNFVALKRHQNENHRKPHSAPGAD